MANEETTLQFMMQVLDQYSSMAKNMSEAARQTINSFLDVIRDNTGARELKKYLNADKENSAAVYFCKKEHQEKLDKSLTEAGICHVSCKRADMNGNAMFLVADKDVQKVDILFNKFRAEINKGGLVSKEVLWDQADGDVLKLTGISAEELMLFDEKAKKAGINIAIQNKYDVLFDKKDAVKMQRVAASVAYDRCGKAGKILMQQAEYENKNSCRIGERVLQKEKRPFYIVDKDGGVAMCTENSLEYEVDKASEELEYTLLEFLDDFSLSIPQYGTIKAQEGMEPVVILTSNNYRDLSDALKRRCNYLYIPRKTKEEIVEILKMKVQASTAIIEGVASCLYQLQELRLKQTPSISEGITWAAYLQKLMDDDDFDIKDSLCMLCKNKEDQLLVQETDILSNILRITSESEK